MKLYTEEQLQEAYNRGLVDGRLHNVDYSVAYGFTSIALPTNEEIVKESEKWQGQMSGHYCFSQGAQFVLDKIKKQ